MRALIVTNMYPSPGRLALGSFVRDQVQALRRLADSDLELELFTFEPGSAQAYARAGAELGRRYRTRGRPRPDIVHAHFGLTAWPAMTVPATARAVTLHGTDLAHPRTRKITLAALPFQDLVATVSGTLMQTVPSWAIRHTQAVLPAGVDLERFKPIPRHDARRQLALAPDQPYLLFAADPSRPEKRYDRARQVAGETTLLTLGGVDPAEVPLWVNAANAVLAPSDREGYGLAVLEALACDVPVLATPVGIAPEALAGVPGTLCAPFDVSTWRGALEPHLGSPDPRIPGRRRAERHSTDRMAANVLAAWRDLLS